MNCALSGNPLIEPVVSKKTGHIFEKKLIEAHLDKTGQCPITGINLEANDLIPLQISKTILPRQSDTSSFPEALKTLQSEWNSLVFEQHELKSHADQLRK